MGKGWLAYDALVQLQEAKVDRTRAAFVERFRELFREHFDDFGDKDPDDTFDVGD